MPVSVIIVDENNPLICQIQSSALVIFQLVILLIQTNPVSHDDIMFMIIQNRPSTGRQVHMFKIGCRELSRHFYDKKLPDSYEGFSVRSSNRISEIDYKPPV